MCIKVFKEELAWAVHKRFQFTISYYTILLETSKKQKAAINNFQLSKQF